jgi:hypothetical protein
VRNIPECALTVIATWLAARFCIKMIIGAGKVTEPLD